MKPHRLAAMFIKHDRWPDVEWQTVVTGFVAERIRVRFIEWTGTATPHNGGISTVVP